MPPLYRVATTDTFDSETSLETVQEIEVSEDSLSNCDSYTDSPSVSSTYSTSPGTPSTSQTTFSIPDEPWQKVKHIIQPGGVPANDWGYDLYHSESRQSDSSSLKPKPVKSSKGFGFSRKKSVSDLTPGLAQLEPFRVRSTPHVPSRQTAPLTLNQLDILRAAQVSRPDVPPPPLQPAPHQSRLAALAKFGHIEQVTGAVKLVVRSKGDEGDAGADDNVDAESVFTTITTASTSSDGSGIVPVYGRGGAGRSAGARVTTRTYGSINALAASGGMHSTDELRFRDDIQLEQSRGSKTSGTSGGKAFLGRILGSDSNCSQQADSGSSPSGSVGYRKSPTDDNLSNLAASSSRDSLATIHSSPSQAPAKVVAYGRGGASRKPLAVLDKEKRVEEKEKPKSRTAALMSSMRKGEKSNASKVVPDEKAEALPAYGRGGFARKTKHQ